MIVLCETELCSFSVSASYYLPPIERIQPWVYLKGKIGIKTNTAIMLGVTLENWLHKLP